jgi:large conductance mechanosensitive channel
MFLEVIFFDSYMTRRKPEIKIDTPSKKTIEAVKKPVQGFFDFLQKHSIISLSIGVVIGQTTKDTVNTLVSGLITPAIQLLIPKTDFQNLVLHVHSAEFKLGEVIDGLIELVLVLMLLYVVFGVILKREDLLSKKKKRKKKKKQKQKAKEKQKAKKSSKSKAKKST